MNEAMKSLKTMLKLNTRLFLNCFHGVDEASALKRLEGGGNNMAFLAIHIVEARYYLASLLGAETVSPFKGKLDDVSSVDEMKEYPKLSDLAAWWRGIGEVLEGRFVDVSDEDLARKSPLELPIDDPTLLGTTAFLMGHESLHIGQLAFLRRQLGFASMSYGVIEDQR